MGSVLRLRIGLPRGWVGTPRAPVKKKKKNRVKHRLYPGERIEGEQEGTEMNTKETETWRS